MIQHGTTSVNLPKRLTSQPQIPFPELKVIIPQRALIDGVSRRRVWRIMRQEDQRCWCWSWRSRLMSFRLEYQDDDQAEDDEKEKKDTLPPPGVPLVPKRI